MTHDEILQSLERVAADASSAEALMNSIVTCLRDNLADYNWVGFYLLDESGAEPMLVLGPFVGAETPHTRIPLNRGICGAAASTGTTVVVDDVNADPRYLACSLETKSEIVAPIFAHGKVVGELDIDSHRHASFRDEADRTLVEACASLVGRYLEGERA